MRKILLSFFALLGGMQAWAQDEGYSIDGINYYVYNGQELHVISTPSASGDVTIPYVLNIDGADYHVTAIDDYAFSGCEGLTSVSLNEDYGSGFTIGSGAFSGCTGLTSISLSSSVTVIGDNAFQGCTGLTSVSFSGNNIGDNAFYGCTDLTSVSISANVSNIGVQAFYECTSLSTVTIDETGNYGLYNVLSIGQGAFHGCSELTSITIPKRTISIGSNPFTNCWKLASISVAAGNSCYDSRDNCNAIIEKSTNKLISGCKNTVIPNSVTAIGDAAFHGCTFTTIEIPDNVTSIGDAAFAWCEYLESLTIPADVNSIGESLFEGSYSLTEIVIPSNVVAILSKTFADCTGLTTVTIPASVETVAADAFYNCSSLTEIHLPANPDDIQFDIAVLPVSASLIYDIVDESTTTATTVTLAANYTTFCSTADLNFASVTGLKAYIVSGYDEGYVLMTHVTNVPAGTGLVLYGTSGQSYDIPAGNGRAVLSNLLIGVTESTTIYKTEGEYTNYILARGTDGTIGFHPLKSASSTLGAGKAYLHLPTWAVETPSGARSFRLIADDGTTFDETTGIADLQTEQGSAEYFDLQGRKVTVSSINKGLYIVNGRKVILK